MNVLVKSGLRTFSAALLVTASTWLAPTIAGSADDDRSQADEIVAEYGETLGPGLAVGVFESGQLVYSSSKGLASLENRREITADTVFCLGSVSKQFTAFAAQLLIAEGKMSLRTDARDFLPYLSHFPKPIEVRHLIHHTSGLKDVWNTFLLGGLSEVDAIEQGHLRQMTARQHGLSFPTGTEAEYNNSGYAVLADLVAEISGEDFDDFMETRVFRPLGMTNTTVRSRIGQIIPNAASPHAKTSEAGWQKVPFTYVGYGASGVWSSVNDLGKWLSNLSDPIDAHRGAVGNMFTSGQLDDGTPINYASGLLLQRIAGHDAFEHGGHDQDFVAFSLVVPEAGKGIAVLANARMPVGDIAYALAEVFWRNNNDDADVDSPRPPAAEKVASRLLSEAPGVYSTENANVIVVSKSGRDLMLQRWGEEMKITLLDEQRFVLGDPRRPEEGGRFVPGKGPSDITIVMSATSRYPMRERTYRKLPAGEPGPLVPEAYTGRYYSDELDVMLDVIDHDGVLSVRNKRTLEPLPLVNVAPDIFFLSWHAMAYGGTYTLRFLRERGGRVYRLAFTDADSEFERLDDRLFPLDPSAPQR